MEPKNNCKTDFNEGIEQERTILKTATLGKCVSSSNTSSLS